MLIARCLISLAPLTFASEKGVPFEEKFAYYE